MKIHESGENYLETILVLKQRNGSVRSIDIAAEMGFSKPSISRAVGKLRDEGYLTVEAGGFIELTEMGRGAAEQIYERHNVIADFLERELGVCRETALLDACRIEHILSEESFARMKGRVADIADTTADTAGKG
ncbi:MAG: metal-dependent transcriptional regulator [Clostridiales Family XIII bacterium]|jgi:Mn-dependent DtxR family transcriptional regulator|nr:metal-dependent transcriptional regulator [Clostridiales Family XIII bacterium]